MTLPCLFDGDASTATRLRASLEARVGGARVWYLTVDAGDGINTTLHASEREALDTLFGNFDPEGTLPRDDIQGICDMGVVAYLDYQLVEVDKLEIDSY